MITKSDWKLLGIEPTIDIRQIKKAYAKKIKLYSPEDNAVQFQILRQVYERVLQYVTYADSLRLTEDTFNTEDSIYEEDTLYDPSGEKSEINEKGNVKSRFHENSFSESEIGELSDEVPSDEKFVQQVTNLYADFNSRIDPKKWDEIINDLVMWDIETYRILKTWFLDFLYAGHFVPSKVMESYNKYFLWELNSEEYYQKYDNLFLTYIKEQISGIITPGYEYLTGESCEDIEAYIRYREHGFAQYLSGDWDSTCNLRCALEMIPDDPYLLCIFGAYMDATDSSDGKGYIKLGSELSADPWRMYLFGGQLLHRMGKYKKALRYFRKIPKTSYYYIKAQSAITDSLCNMNKYLKCGFLLRSNLKKNREVTELKDVLSEYYGIILELKKSFPNRLDFLYEAREIFPYVNNSVEKNPHKFTSNYILSSLELAVRIIFPLLLLLGIIATVWMVFV
ncbi:MAG: hypothetical protein WBI07_12225 [Mobilitalea sp.]